MKKGDYKIDDINLLIVSYLTRSISEEDLVQLKEWINFSDENRNHFNEFKNAWILSGAKNGSSITNAEESWRVFKNNLTPYRTRLVLGFRSQGKTTFIKEWIAAQPDKKSINYVNGEDIHNRQILTNPSLPTLHSFVGSYKTIIIDEAQSIRDIGLTLKRLVDEMPFVKVIASGSSSFELERSVAVPLTGRKYTITLYPIAQMELKDIEPYNKTLSLLDKRLIYGSYPEILFFPTDTAKKEYLNEMLSSYLFKDILAYEGLRKADKVLELLRMIAWQIGKEVSLTEVGNSLELNKATVEKYLDLLQKVFIIYPRSGFSRNLRNEITKCRRWYFHDNGVLNAVISDFRPLEQRPDVGALWENYLLSERQKLHNCNRDFLRYYYWRTYAQQEIDLVEEGNGEIHGFEIKWKKGSVKPPSAWKNSYPEAGYEVITKDNYLSWITGS